MSFSQQARTVAGRASLGAHTTSSNSHISNAHRWGRVASRLYGHNGRMAGGALAARSRCLIVAQMQQARASGAVRSAPVLPARLLLPAAGVFGVLYLALLKQSY